MKTKEFFLKNIEETNELFNNSSDAEKRVMIAQDCIDRILVKLLNPYKGNMLILETNIDDDLSSLEINKETINDKGCQVCAKGGLFASYIGRVNNFNTCTFSLGNHVNNDAHQKLLEIFSLEQLTIIEMAFENAKYIKSVPISSELEAELENFHNRYESSEERLIAICENIIENKGTFIL